MDFTIADRLVALRREHGYSQESLAAELGLTRQAVSRWERGESLPDTENLIALADLYGVTLDELVRPRAYDLDAEEDETRAGEGDASGAGEAELDASHALAELEYDASPAGVSAPETSPTIPTGMAQEAASASLAEPRATGVPSLGVPSPETTAYDAESQKGSRASHMGGCAAIALVVLLVGAIVLVGGCLAAGSFLSFTHVGSGPTEALDGPDGMVVSETTVNPDEVQSLRIDWEVGSVVVAMADESETNDEILVRETYPNTEEAGYSAQLDVAHGELSISYGFIGGGEAFREGKQLTVLLPSRMAGGLDTVRASVSAGELEVSQINCAKLGVEASSGHISLEDVTTDDLHLKVSSGLAEAEGVFPNRLRVEASSGSVDVTDNVTPKRAKVSVGAGGATLSLPRDANFEVQSSVGAGDFDLAFASRPEGDALLVGKGGADTLAQFTVDVGSGSVRIQPL